MDIVVGKSFDFAVSSRLKSISQSGENIDAADTVLQRKVELTKIRQPSGSWNAVAV